MPDDSITNPSVTDETKPMEGEVDATKNVKNDVIRDVVQKISDAHNVLIALSADPSVDEMATAIGLSLYLDRLGKRATAIYSGETPNALEFLKPEETFENSVDTLQDFVIALNKDKADHLRYKLDGDYVKIFITPYKARISEEDLEFSYGDFNVDLVLALDVANGIDLDSALREHGRIMHDAVIINITTGNPGKLGEIEWSDKAASSVSEMIAKMLYSSDSKVEKEEATAFLTGIVAATDRFKNANTTPETMTVASKLMASGANQQLISKNITPDVENELFGTPEISEAKPDQDADPAKLDVQHGNEVIAENAPEVVDATIAEKESTLLDDLKAAEASLAAAASEVVPEEKRGPVKMSEKNEKEEISNVLPTVQSEETSNGISSGVLGEVPKESLEGTYEEPSEEISESGEDGLLLNKPEKVLQPLSDSGNSSLESDDGNKYGKMLEDALNENQTVSESARMPEVITAPEEGVMPSGDLVANPAATGAPEVASAPEVNGVPEINYMPMPGDEVLPPPPAPPINVDAVASAPTMAPTTTVPTSAANVDPGAFKIPGM